MGTVVARSHTLLSVWFGAAYLVSSQTPGMSAVQLQRQLGLSRYETAFQILHKLRAGMVLCQIKRSAVNPDAVQDNGHLAGDGNPCLFHSNARELAYSLGIVPPREEERTLVESSSCRVSQQAQWKMLA